MSKEVIELIIVDYCNELIAAGYLTTRIENVVFSSLTGYERILESERIGKTDRNRSGVSTMMDRRAKKLSGQPPLVCGQGQK